MKKLSLVLFALLVVTMAGSAFASCPTAPSFLSGGGAYWVDWTQDISCYTVSGVTTATVGCYGATGFDFSYPYVTSAYTVFTPGSGQVYTPTKWEAGSHIELNSPSNSVHDWITLWAYVAHPGGTFDSYVLFHWNGSQGNLSGCAEQYGFFTANVGDTITIKLEASAGSGATIHAGVPHITDGL